MCQSVASLIVRLIVVFSKIAENLLMIYPFTGKMDSDNSGQWTVGESNSGSPTDSESSMEYQPPETPLRVQLLDEIIVFREADRDTETLLRALVSMIGIAPPNPDESALSQLHTVLDSLRDQGWGQFSLDNFMRALVNILKSIGSLTGLHP